MLTPRMKQTLDFVAQYIDRHGFSPTFQEIMEGVDLRSKSGVFRLIGHLVAEGYLRQPKAGKGSRRVRCLEIVAPQSDLDAAYERGYQDGIEAQKQAIDGPRLVKITETR